MTHMPFPICSPVEPFTCSASAAVMGLPHTLLQFASRFFQGSRPIVHRRIRTRAPRFAVALLESAGLPAAALWANLAAAWLEADEAERAAFRNFLEEVRDFGAPPERVTRATRHQLHEALFQCRPDQAGLPLDLRLTAPNLCAVIAAHRGPVTDLWVPLAVAWRASEPEERTAFRFGLRDLAKAASRRCRGRE
jgi:uncharacterized membrane protein